MKKQAKEGIAILPKYLLTDTVFALLSPIVSAAAYSIFRTATNLYAYLITLGRTIPALVAKCKLMAAPLRRIVARELDILTPRPKYQIYSLIDELECGHTRDVYLFGGLFDLLNAYTENPAIRARRHRCIPCAQLLAKKRPQSVPLPAVAKTA